MPKSSGSSGRRSSRKRAAGKTDSADELRKAFDATLNMYRDLARRAAAAPLFLPRTLHRDRKRPPAAGTPPAVTYSFCSDVSKMQKLRWSETVPHMQCLWCKELFYAFRDSDELLVHLKTSHGRFGFNVDDVSGFAPKGKETNGGIQIHMSLLRAAHGPLGIESSDDERPTADDPEDVFVNPRRYSIACRRAAAVASKEQAVDVELSDSEARRPRRACAVLGEDKQEISESRRLSQVVKNAEGATPRPLEDGRGSTSKKRASLAAEKARGKQHAKRIKVDPSRMAYPSVEAAVKEKRLYHSVLQHPLSLRDFNDGVDSDAEDAAEREWRLDLSNFYVCDYVDSLPVEKLFMNLWNQFLTLEHKILADRKVAVACMIFANKYRLIMQRMNLEVIFLRHLTELAKTGLLNSDSVFATLMVLRDRSLEPKSEEEANARFLYADEIIASAEEKEKKASHAGRKRKKTVPAREAEGATEVGRERENLSLVDGIDGNDAHRTEMSLAPPPASPANEAEAGAGRVSADSVGTDGIEADLVAASGSDESLSPAGADSQPADNPSERQSSPVTSAARFGEVGVCQGSGNRVLMQEVDEEHGGVSAPTTSGVAKEHKAAGAGDDSVTESLEAEETESMLRALQAKESLSPHEQDGNVAKIAELPVKVRTSHHSKNTGATLREKPAVDTEPGLVSVSKDRGERVTQGERVKPVESPAASESIKATIVLADAVKVEEKEASPSENPTHAVQAQVTGIITDAAGNVVDAESVEATPLDRIRIVKAERNVYAEKSGHDMEAELTTLKQKSAHTSESGEGGISKAGQRHLENSAASQAEVELTRSTYHEIAKNPSSSTKVDTPDVAKSSVVPSPPETAVVSHVTYKRLSAQEVERQSNAVASTDSPESVEIEFTSATVERHMLGGTEGPAWVQPDQEQTGSPNAGSADVVTGQSDVGQEDTMAEPSRDLQNAVPHPQHVQTFSEPDEADRGTPRERPKPAQAEAFQESTNARTEKVVGMDASARTKFIVDGDDSLDVDIEFSASPHPG